MITAASVSAKLRRLGFNGMRSDYRREGIHVRNFSQGMVSISVDYDSDRAAARRADEIGEALRAEGFTILTEYGDRAGFVVTR